MTALVVTSIAAPNDILKSLADGAQASGWSFYIVGDVSSPSDFSLRGARFYDLDQQLATGLATAAACPRRHYARKNIGYLLAIREGASVIVESDDDNRPLPAFWRPRSFSQRVRVIAAGGWTNVYQYFSDELYWPRGFPLDSIRRPAPDFQSLPEAEVYCPIQQSLVDGDPDVDAIHRLVFSRPPAFRRAPPIAVSSGALCPFNSQNTSWSREAFPLLYLPAYCSFRMTDIWRSFIAQRIAFENGWSILFNEATTNQERNEHDLLRDFQDEVPGYLHNRSISETLGQLTLRPGGSEIPGNLGVCYEALIGRGFMDRREMAVLDAWISDLQASKPGGTRGSALPT